MAIATPTAKAEVDPNFEKRLRDLKTHAKTEAAARPKGQPVKWFRPQGWNGDPHDWEGLGEPFDRTKANTDYENAVKQPDQPGTSGDIAATTTMIEELAAMERAFRVRHTLRRPRAVAHMLGRKQGHGSDQGPLIVSGLEYVRSLLARAKQPA